MNEPRVLVSACLLGCKCRYDGRGNLDSAVASEAAKRGWIPICPEILGGLTTPRVPAERLGDKIVGKDGSDVTNAFHRGAAETARIAKLYGAKYAVLKERSPSCGPGIIYDGTFTGARVPGDGATVEALKALNIRIFGESRLNELLALLEEEHA